MKTYVLGTSVLLSVGKSALSSFEDSTVIVPIGVVKQLELHTKDPVLGWIARSVLTELERLRDLATSQGSNISEGGVQVTDKGGKLRVETNHRKVPRNFPASAAEASNTLKVAANLLEEGSDIVLVTNDLTQRLLASIMNLPAQPFRAKSLQGEYTGMSKLPVTPNLLSNSFYSRGHLLEDELPEAKNFPAQHGFILEDGNANALAVKRPDGTVHKISTDLLSSQVKGRSAEQHLAIHHLLNPEVDVVSLGGAAGTGKTLLALAAGYKLLQSPESGFKKILVFRPLHEVGKQELGFLPGAEEEKMEPWTQAIKDALEVFLEPNAIRREMERGRIEVAPTSFIRGRTINNAFIIIDEAQNFERLTLLSVLSRLGAGSKCVLSWDAAQRDNLYINKNDGVVAVVDRLKEQDIVAHVTLTKSERSRAAKMATDVLEELDY